MDELTTIWIPAMFIFTVSGTLLSCFCLRKRSRVRVRSSSSDPPAVVNQTSQVPPTKVPSKEQLKEPHPFLPLSLYSGSGTTNAGTMGGRMNTHPESLTVLDSSFLVTNACAGVAANPVSHLLLRQEGNSHRNCELPPVPSSSDYQDPNVLLASSRPPAPPYNTVSPALKIPGQLGSEAVLSDTVPGVVSNEPILSRLSRLSDDPQSESDGLYASVGHAATGCSSMCRDHLPGAHHDSTRMHKSDERRQSVNDSLQGPYYSSVVSVGCPAEYGEIGEMVPPRSQTVPATVPTPQTRQCDLYARVKPRADRGLNQPGTYTHAHASAPIRSALVPDANSSAPMGSCLVTAATEPPIPERGYGQNEIELVHQNRLLLSSPGCTDYYSSTYSPSEQTNDTRQRSTGTMRSSGSPDANVPLIRRLLNAIQLINARHYHDNDQTGLNTSSDRVDGRCQSSSAGGDYRKITVRESLASLRARNALPLVDPVPSQMGAQMEYERVYGAPGESNSSTTYEVVPGSRDSPNIPYEFNSTRTGNSNHMQESGDRQSKRLSDIYSEIPYTTCYALPFTSPIDASSSDAPSPSAQTCSMNIGLPGATSTLTRSSKSPEIPSFSTNPGVTGGVERSDVNNCKAGSPLHSGALGTTSVLAEMQRFRHMDSEVDLTYARTPYEVDQRRSNLDQSTAIKPDRATFNLNSLKTPVHSASQDLLSHSNRVNTAGSSGMTTSESFNHSLMPPLMERSMEEGSLPALSHPTTPSLSSSVLSSPLNEAEPVSSVDSDRLVHSTVPIHNGLSMQSGNTGFRGLSPFPPSMFSSRAYLRSGATSEASPRVDTVTYDDVALS